jgi:DNA-binding response OmpR family regulator
MKVLVVDDNKNDRLLLFTLLKSHNYDVSQAGNGIEALEKIEQEMPDIIFYSATYNTDKDIEFGLSLGESRFFIKPMDPRALLFEIEVVIKEFEAGVQKSAKLSITPEEYRKKYGQGSTFTFMLPLVSKMEENK